MTRTNWAGNLTYGSSAFHEPGSVEELQELVAASSRVRAIGTRHSFNRVADTEGGHVSVTSLPSLVRVDEHAAEVVVSAGLRYGELVAELDRTGWALSNLASLPHISVAGAIATGTHGSGDSNGSLATAVAALEVVAADGSMRTIRRGDPDFDGSVVALGCTGVVTHITLDVEPTYDIRQDVFEHLSWSAVHAHLDEITSSAYSVSMFTDWSDHGPHQVWLKSRAGAAPPVDLFGATPASDDVHPLPGVSAEHTTKQLGRSGRWWDRLPHFRMGFTPSNGEELQTEYLVPRRHALDAIDSVRALAPAIHPLLLVSEIRTVAADQLWLSPSHSTDCVALHFTWRRNVEGVTALLPTLDDALAPFVARPHWGKLFETTPERLLAAYSRLPEFRALTERIDPTGKFRNEVTDSWLRP